jgi:hypothetical protein
MRFLKEPIFRQCHRRAVRELIERTADEVVDHDVRLELTRYLAANGAGAALLVHPPDQVSNSGASG